MNRLIAFAAALGFAAPALALDTEPDLVEDNVEYVTRNTLFGARVESKQSISMTWSSLLAKIEGSCHGCTGYCTGHTHRLSRQAIAQCVNESVNKVSGNMNLKKGAKVGADIEIKDVGKIAVGEEQGLEGQATASSENRRKDESSTTTAGDFELGCRTHAPPCWTWEVTGEAWAVISLSLVRTRTRYNLVFNLDEKLADEIVAPPVVGVHASCNVKETYCCHASKAGGG
ncbi:MAG: hypothetical protein MUC63_09100, partial [Planctomycetes bacterium]|nr:hypothetical protein [Planctomycetota bacterium]